MAINYGSLPFKEQIAFFKAKKLVPTKKWDDLIREQHDAGFMIAGAMQADLLADLYNAVEKALSKGITLDAFRDDFDNIVEKRGWTGWAGEGTAAGVAWRTRVIYETNLHSSYQAGRWAQIQEVKKDRPYLMYSHSHSANPRHQHVAWDGLVFPADSDWVKTHYPPNGWGCKCRMFSVSGRDLKRLNKKVTQNRDDGIDEKTGMPKGIDKNWNYAPGASRVDGIKDQMSRKADAMPDAIGSELRKFIA